MGYAECGEGRIFLLRPDYGAELLSFLVDFAREKGIRLAAFTALGALRSARLGYYDQDRHEYREIEVGSPCELAGCVGNISVKDGEPFVHAHVVLADERGEAKAGHLLRGEVFSAEVFLRELRGAELVRRYDERTGLMLWEI